MINNVFRSFAVIGVITAQLIAFSGCSLTPEYQRPDLDEHIGESFNEVEANPFEDVSQSRLWWQQFNDPIIDQLVDKAIENNLDLQIAASNILENQAAFRAATGALFPRFDFASRTERAFTGNSTGSSFATGSDRTFFNTFELGTTVSWQLDLFGRLRAMRNVARSERIASEEDREAMLQTIIADVVRQRVEIAFTQQRLQIAHQTLENRVKTLNIIERRYANGARDASAVDLHQARESVYGSESDMTALKQNLSLLLIALDRLLGQTPQTLSISEHDLAALPRLDIRVVGAPVALLDNRPDLRAAEFRLIAQNYQVGASLASLYPDVVIDPGIGYRNDELRRIITPSNLFGRLSANLALPLFAGGQLRADVDAAKKRYDTEALRYTQAVVQAVSEVEDALVRNRTLEQRIEQLGQQVEEARQAAELSLYRYEKSGKDLLTVFDSERRLRAAEDTLLQSRMDYWNARVDLYLAVGGQWLDIEPQALTRTDKTAKEHDE